MSDLRELEAPLRSWRSFRDIARATRALAAAQALQWTKLVRKADRHLAWCEAVAASYKRRVVTPPSPHRFVLALGSDLGLCGALNRAVAERCRVEDLANDPTALSVVVGSRLRAFDPLPGSIDLPAPSTFAAAERCAANIEDLMAQLPDPLAIELTIVLTTVISGDAHPSVELRSEAKPDLELDIGDRRWLVRASQVDLGRLEDAARQARLLARHARIIAALARSVAAENEARWRTMGRAHESAQRRIAQQERRVRRLRQELITQEMLDARRGGRRRNERSRR